MAFTTICSQSLQAFILLTVPSLSSETLSSALTILTAMITPAVLISACGTLILSTSVRLGRVVDRVRALSEKLEEFAHGHDDVELIQERREILFKQLDHLTTRARWLQRSLSVFYFALGMFVATSVSIGIVAVSGGRYQWIPVVIGLLGALLLFYGCVPLLFEARLALITIKIEMDFTWKLGQRFAPERVLEERQKKKEQRRYRREETGKRRKEVDGEIIAAQENVE